MFRWSVVTPWTGGMPGFPVGSAGKESTCNAGDLGLIPELGRSPGEGKGYPLPYSGLQNSMDCIVHEVAKSWTQLSDFHFTLTKAYSSNDQRNTLLSPMELPVKELYWNTF